MGRVRRGAAGLEPATQPVMDAVAELLGYHGNDTVRLVAFVGALEGNAFGARMGETIMTCLPVEQAPEQRKLIMPHEFTHVVHMLTAGFTSIWERPIAQIMLEEGLAIHSTATLVPGHPAEAYLEHKPGWVQACKENRAAVLRRLLASVSDSRSETVFQVTMGTGTTGLEREAYYGGWLAVGHLLAQGSSLAELAHVPPQTMVELQLWVYYLRQ